MRAELEKNDVPEDVIAAIVGAEAPLRHRARVEDTIAASEEAARALVGDWGETEIKALGAFLRLMDLVGTGGSLGLQGHGTTRMAWARSLGKGRFQASDGAAWRAALESSLAWTPIEKIDVAAKTLIIETNIDDHPTRIEIPADAAWLSDEIADRFNRFRRLCGIWNWGSHQILEQFRYRHFFSDHEAFEKIAKLPELRALR